MSHDLEKQLESVKPKGLTKTERTTLWSHIEANLVAEKFMSAHNSKRSYKKVIAVSTIIALLFGGSATIAFADNSRPGDFLFPIDVAIEKVRINIASPEKKDELRVAYAKERVSEIKELLVEVENDEAPTSLAIQVQDERIEEASAQMDMAMMAVDDSVMIESATTAERGEDSALEAMEAKIIIQDVSDMKLIQEDFKEEEQEIVLSGRANNAFLIAMKYLEASRDDNDRTAHEIDSLILELRKEARSHASRVEGKRIATAEKRIDARSQAALDKEKVDGVMPTTSADALDFDLERSVEELAGIDIEKELDIESLERLVEEIKF